MPKTESHCTKNLAFRKCSSQVQSVKHLGNDNDKRNDLMLTGSQVHLTYRQRMENKKINSLPTPNIHSKRPMSALSSFGHQRHSEVVIDESKRPQSVDIPYFVGGNQSAPSSAELECEIHNNRQDLTRKWCDGVHHRKSNTTSCTVSVESNNSDKDTVRSDVVQSNLAEVEKGFGETFTLPSSQLLENLTAQPLGRTWTEAELRECCSELGIENTYMKTYEFESLGSDCSNEPCHSEKSLGEKIIAMAQEINFVEPLSRLPLEPGVKAKPPIPQNPKLTLEALEKCEQSSALTSDSSHDKTLFKQLTRHEGSMNEQFFSIPSSCNKSAEILDECNEVESNSNAISFKSTTENTDLQNNSAVFNSNFTKFLKAQDNIINNIQPFSINIGEFNKTLQDTVLHKSYNSKSNLLDRVDHFTDGFSDLRFQNLFPDSDIILQNSHLSVAERETDVLLESLAMEQHLVDCSDSCDSFSFRARYFGGNDADCLGRNRRQELYLECLVEEDTNERRLTDNTSTTRSIGSNKNCYSSLDRYTKDAEKDCDLSQKKKKMDGKGMQQIITPVDILSNNGKNEDCSMFSQHDTSKKENTELKLRTGTALNSPNTDLVTSWLNKQLDNTDENKNTLHIQQVILESNEDAINIEPSKVVSLETQYMDEKQQVQKTNSTNKSTNGMPVSAFDLDVNAAKALGTSTYDEIISILKVLEEEDTHSHPKLSGFKQTSEHFDSSRKEFTPEGKMRDILIYLDEIEHGCDAAIESAKNQLEIVKDKTRSTELKLKSTPRLEDLLLMSTLDLAHEVLALHLQLEERNSSINLLQETLNQQRELTVSNMRNADRDLKTKLSSQKNEYEAAIARHQKFIDQLIADKKCISEKCQSLVEELRKSETHHAATLKAVEERHKIELQKAKEMHAAAEKLRRERWIDNKTQKIKEMTVKGLEPELERLNTRHQQELADLRMLHKQELDELELRATRKLALQLEQLRDQLSAEKEAALIKERDLLRSRIEKQAEQEEIEFEAKRKKFLAEIRQEKERLAEEGARLQRKVEEEKQNLYKENAKTIEKLKSEMKEELDALKRKHQNELKTLKEELEVEKQEWTHQYKKEQAEFFSQRELEIREQFKKERDKEIELIIERLENEATQNRTEMEQVMDNRIRRLKEKFETEMKDLEASEVALKNKHNEIKQQLLSKEDEVISLKAKNRQMEKELEEAKKIMDKLSAERAKIKEIIKKEYEMQLLSASEENIKLREEIAELKTRHQIEFSNKEKEIVRMMADKERQLQQVYDRVKLAVAKKDEAIQVLRSQHKAALERCSHLEDLLEQQRHDYLLK